MKTKQIRRWAPLALGLTLVAALGFASGEAEATGADGVTINKTGFPIATTTLSQTWVAAYHIAGVPYDQIDQVVAYEELTNIDIEWISIPSSNVREKVNIMVASGDYPDVFYGGAALGAGGKDWANLNGAEGLFIPLQDLVDEWGPNIKQALEDKPIARAASVAPDGNMYSLPRISNPNHPTIPRKLYINQDWLDTLGVGIPQTAREFYEVLTMFKEQDVNGNGDPNDEIPYSLVQHNLSGFDAQDSWIKLMGPWGVESEFPIRDGALTLGFVSDGYREALRFYKRLVDEELLDVESFAQNQQVLRAKAVVDGTPVVGVFTKMAAFQIVGSGLVDYDKPMSERTYAAMPPFEGPTGDRLWYYNAAQQYAPGAFVITAVNEHPEASIRWVDTHFDPEEAVFWQAFPREYYTDLGDGRLQPPSEYPNGWSFAEARHRLTVGSQSVSYQNNATLDFEIVEGLQGIALNEEAELMGRFRPDESISPSLLSFTLEEAEYLATYEVDLYNYVSESMARFMTGDLSIDGDWDAYVSQVLRLRAEEIRDVYQAAYDRFRGN